MIFWAQWYLLSYANLGLALWIAFSISIPSWVSMEKLYSCAKWQHYILRGTVTKRLGSLNVNVGSATTTSYCSWTSCLIISCLNFLICRMRITVLPHWVLWEFVNMIKYIDTARQIEISLKLLPIINNIIINLMQIQSLPLQLDF